MIFTRTFERSDTPKDAMDELYQYLQCGAEVVIRRIDGRMRAEIDVDDPHEFLDCAAKYVSEHQLSAWEREAEEDQADLEDDEED